MMYERFYQHVTNNLVAVFSFTFCFVLAFLELPYSMVRLDNALDI